jgi:cellulose synthase/poly-beta-1,6-N-acetylglucosamine synthase-like glycosyltransferase
LKALSEQTIAKEKVEFIFIDDNSEDESVSLIAESLYDFRFDFQILMLPKDKSGKKAATEAGVTAAKNEYILCTDADCIPEKTWAETFSAFAAMHEPDLTFGEIYIKSTESLFSKLQFIEFAALVTSGSILLEKGKPLYGNAANMLFRKKTFEEAGGYTGNKHIPSGDDEFLLKKVKARKGKILFLKSSLSRVSTLPALSVQEFLNQRVRWASKWSAHGSIAHAGSAFLVFVFQLYRVIFPTLIFFNVAKNELLFFLLTIACFFLSEFVLLRQITAFIKISGKSFAILLCQLIYPFYVISVALMTLHGDYMWKGRFFRKE